MPKPATRLTNLPSYIFAVLGQRIQEMTAQGLDVISLDIGSPDLPPPQPVIDALKQSAQRPNNHGYTGYRGIPAFRQAVARYYKRRFNVVLDPEHEVLPLIGSKEGIVNLCMAFLDQGDYALVPNVGYPSYSMGARLAGGNIHWLDFEDDQYYHPNTTNIPKDILLRAKLFWVNFPNNPTGATVEVDYYNELVKFCSQHDLLLVSDNPYVDVTYDGYKAPSVLQARNSRKCSIEFMSCSKTYNMGGWRIGAAVGNAEVLKILLQVKSNVDSGHFRPIYDAGVVALDETPQSWIDDRNKVYSARRDRILEALPSIGLVAHKPKGSLYIWGRVLAGDGDSYVDAALREELVALAAGSAYGPGGKQYVRISLGVPDDRLTAALDRLKHWYSSYKTASQA
jgi:LL-diaminopimelate aminotransferase